MEGRRTVQGIDQVFEGVARNAVEETECSRMRGAMRAEKGCMLTGGLRRRGTLPNGYVIKVRSNRSSHRGPSLHFPRVPGVWRRSLVLLLASGSGIVGRRSVREMSGDIQVEGRTNDVPSLGPSLSNNVSRVSPSLSDSLGPCPPLGTPRVEPQRGPVRPQWPP